MSQRRCEQLAELDRAIANAETRVINQRRLIGRLSALGMDIHLAGKLLLQLNAGVATMLRRRGQILHDLHTAELRRMDGRIIW